MATCDEFEKLKKINGIVLTPREIDCLSCIVSGRSSKFIASLLSLSVRTVEAHIHNIMCKVKCNSRQQLITFAQDARKDEALRNRYYRCLRQSLFEKALKDIRSSMQERQEGLVFCFSQGLDPLYKIHVNLLKIHTELLTDKITFSHKNITSQRTLVIKKRFNFSKKKPVQPIIIDLDRLRENYYQISIKFFSTFLPKETIKNLLNIINATPQIENINKKKIKNKNMISTYKILPIFLYIIFVVIYVGYYYKNNLYLFISSRNGSSNVSNIKANNATYILDRKNLLNTIDEKLSKQKGIKTVILVGIGGCGKTTLAREYARKHRKAASFEIHGDSQQSIINSFIEIAYILAKTVDQKKELDWIQKILTHTTRNTRLFRFVMDRLKDQNQWILIYDNVGSFVEIKDYFPPTEGELGEGIIVITTQDATMECPNQQRNNSIVDIGELSQQEALILFTEILSLEKPVEKGALQSLEKFLVNIPYFPLDISIAAYFIKNNQLSLSKYFQKISQENSDLIASQESLFKEGSEYKKTRKIIIIDSLMSILLINPVFNEIALNILLMDSNNIPKNMLYFFENEILTNQLIYYLKRFSLITSSPKTGSDSFSIHKNTQKIALSYLEDKLNLNSNEILVEKISKGLNCYAKKIIENSDYKKMRGFLPHLKVFLSRHGLPRTKSREELEFILGDLYLQLNDPKTAVGIFSENVERLPKEKNCLLLSKNLACMGNSFKFFGKYSKAKKFLEKSLFVYQSCSEEEGQLYRKILLDLGKIYRIVGNYQAAQTYTEQSLSLDVPLSQEKENPISLTNALTSMGAVYRFQGQYKKAYSVIKRSLLLHQEALKNQFPGFAWTLTQLGILYSTQGNYKQASLYLRQAIDLYRRKFTDSKREMAHALVSLAYVTRKLGDMVSSDKYLCESLSIFSKYFGVDYAESVWLYANLGINQRVKGRYKEAEAHLKKSLEIFSTHFPQDHPEKAWVQMHLGIVMRCLGKSKEALNMLIESHELFSKTISESQLTNAWMISEIGRTYMELEDFINAKVYLEKSYDLFVKYHGKKTIKTSWIGVHLSQLYARIGLLEKASLLLNDALQVHSIHYGSSHHRVLRIKKLLSEIERT